MGKERKSLADHPIFTVRSHDQSINFPDWEINTYASARCPCEVNVVNIFRSECSLF